MLLREGLGFFLSSYISDVAELIRYFIASSKMLLKPVVCLLTFNDFLYQPFPGKYFSDLYRRETFSHKF